MYPWGNVAPTAELATYARTADYVYQGGVTRVGEHPGGRSREGVDDLAGNVSEWVSDWYSESFRSGDVRDPTGPAEGSQKTLRGSSWRDPEQRLQATRRYSASEDHRADDTGFRCAKSKND
jgi:formylglycine-generating enzyme required for sulfatase activity